MTILLIIALVFVFISLFVFLYFNKTNKILKLIFKDHSTYTYGAKGKGKDLLFQKVISLRKAEPYYSNIGYGGSYNHLNFYKLSTDHTIKDMINDNINPIDFVLREQADIYLSDAGIYFPNWEDNELKKKFPYLATFIAVQRHLYLSNTHLNSQAFNRVWKVLREQADYFIKALKVVKTPFGLFAKIRLYDMSSSAEKDLRPYRKHLFSKNSLSRDDYESTNGLIIERWYHISKNKIKYDTRFFKKLFMIGSKFPISYTDYDLS